MINTRFENKTVFVTGQSRNRGGLRSQRDNAWFVQRRQKPGPVSFSTMSLDERHALMPTPTALSGGEELRSSFCRRPGTWIDELAMLHDRMSTADRRELKKRQTS